MVVFSVCVSLIFMMPGMMQPLSLGLCVMVLSVIFCLLISLSVSSWYGYILFLVYVGGLLVMFAYVSALAPNNYFSSVKSLMGFFSVFVVSFMVIGGLYFIDYNLVSSVGEFSGVKGMACSGMMIISPSSMSLIIVLGTILLVNLLAVVKVCYYQQGPLRSHFELK
uniref:NADH dehydrogenase subunit 6 n=1 Tax=Trochus sacellum TaxID=2985241 RepID=UPI0022372EB7|nr:NADH dehydrogenase subunit 6 [Trochus sacellum]UYC29886.1 NADH dehydrogenase subunit 6 [Trochus sacellum]